MGAPGVREALPVAVVGSGPCGVAAAVQLRRSGTPVLLFERDRVGGLLWNANLVENYPGFPRGIPGPALCRLLERHLAAVGIAPCFEPVREIGRVSGALPSYRLRTGTGRAVTAGAVVLATGTRPVEDVVPDESALRGRRVFYEVKDLYNRARGVEIAVLGGGDAAHDYALNLAARGARVYLLRRSPPRCLPLLAERVAACPGVAVEDGVRVRAVKETGRGVRMHLEGTGGLRDLEAAFLLVACGRVPEDGLLSSIHGREGTAGEDPPTFPDLPPGLFAGGDLVRGSFRQAGIAVGDGLLAAMDAVRYLRTLASPGSAR